MHLEGKIVTGKSVGGKDVKGRVLLVFDDAITSGTDMYVSVTYLMVSTKEGDTHTVRPRDVTKVADEY